MTLKNRLDYQPAELKFGTSGLRALVTEMTDLECYINTLGFIRFCQNTYPEVNALYVAGDLRDSTPRIVSAVARAGQDAGLNVTFLGYVPTPVLALRAFTNGAASVMVTGSHIPSDRNGIKYYKPDQELMKTDELKLLEFVKTARAECYGQETDDFKSNGMLTRPAELKIDDLGAKEQFFARLGPFTNNKPLEGLQIGVYEHSAVGRDYLKELLELAGAKVIGFGRSDTFIPVDTENVTADVKKVLEDFVAEQSIDAIVSTDGDSDRPLIADEKGHAWSGDVLGLITADELGVTACAYPVSSNDMLDSHFLSQDTEIKKTKIGSPHVIAAMDEFGAQEQVVGWEVNGGFMVGQNIGFNGENISPLKTRDAFLPLLLALIASVQSNRTIGELFGSLKPKRYGNAGLMDIDSFEKMQGIISKLSGNKDGLSRYFSSEKGFGFVEEVDMTDGVRIVFSNQDVAHVRGSGNAPQLRIYSTANTKERANEIVKLCLGENGIFKELQNE